jgi:hypothetical protein
MNFSPEYLSTLLVRPLRYLFQHYAPDELKWTDDPKTTGVEIDTINNFNKKPIQQKPRILVSRGQYSVEPVGLTDNLAQGRGIYANKGLRENKNMFFIKGIGQIMVEARNEGTCERVLNLTQHFLAWTGPMLADVYGFKNTFLPMNVSPCVPQRENTEVFSATINLPWSKEEQWMVKSGDEIKVKNFLLTLVRENSD